jgi:hypothetical protein
MGCFEKLFGWEWPSRYISKCSAEMHRGARTNSPYSGKGPRWTLLDCDLVI